MTSSANRVPRRLGRADFNRPAVRVARGLLGKFIVREAAGERLEAMIVETEAYVGPRDQACHARNGRRTARVEPLYGEGGTAYVYLAYGIHWLLNFSTGGAGKPQGVLIRGVAVEAATRAESGSARGDPRGGRLRARCEFGDGLKPILGPGRVTQYLKIDKRLDGADATRSEELRIEDRGVRIPKARVRRGPRVGIEYAGPVWAAKPWRFWAELGAEKRKMFQPRRLKGTKKTKNKKQE